MNRMLPTSPSWNVLSVAIPTVGGLIFGHLQYNTCQCRCNVYVLLETTNHLLRLLDEVGYYFLVIVDVIALAKYIGATIR